MTSPRTRWIAGALALAALAVPPAAPAADDPIPSSKRPHSRAATYVRDGIVVRRLLFQGRRVGAHIVGTMGAAVENRSQTARTVHLRIGRCTRGRLSRPVCPSARVVALRIPAGRRVSAIRHVRLRQPPPREDAIELSVTRPGARAPYGHVSNHGSLLLRGRAWRSGRSVWYGLQAARAVAGEEVLRAVVDVPATARTRIRPVIAWEGTATAAAPWLTAARLCAFPVGCDLTPETRRWSTAATPGRVAFQERPSFTGESAVVRVTVQSPGGRLLTVDLPRPL